MPNKKLERNQRRAHKKDISKYTFTCEGGGVVCNQSPEITSEVKGIRLHFLRYGLFNKNSNIDNETFIEASEYSNTSHKAIVIKDEKSEHYDVDLGEEYSKDETNTEKPPIPLEEVEILKIKEIPKLDNFYTARTALRAGYIYLMNDEDPDDYYELEVDDQGYLSHILWEYNKDKKGKYKDVRQSVNEKLTYKVIKPGKKMWIAFSPIQWSRDYHHEINTNSEKRKARMKLIDCSGFKKGEQSKEQAVIPFNEVSAVFHKDHVYSNVLQSNLHEILADEKRQDEKGDNELLEDMFICLDDSIGAIEDVYTLLEQEIENHRASLESLRFGEDPKEVLKRIKNGTKKEKLSEREQELSSMFSLALTTYQMVYNDSESAKKYDGGLEGIDLNVNLVGSDVFINYDKRGLLKEKLTTILGVKQRKEQRQLIRSLQRDLASILQSDYLDKKLIDFVDGSDLCNIIAKDNLIKHFSLLAVNPHDIDRSLDLKKHQEKDNIWDSLIENIILCQGPRSNLEKTLDRLANIDDKAQIDAEEMTVNLANKTAAFADKLIGSVAKITTKKQTTVAIQTTMEFVVKKLNKVTAFNMEMYEVRGHEVIEQLPEKTNLNLAQEDLGKYTGRKDLKRFNVKSPNIKLKHSSYGKHVFELPVESQMTKTVDAPTKLAEKAKSFIRSDCFKGTVAILQVYNLGVASNIMAKNQDFKSFVNLVGVISELSEAVLNLREIQLARQSRLLSSTSSSILRISSIAGATITVIMCAWDAYDSFSARDTDAAWAYVGAGAAFTGVTVATVFATASWAGPLGWICAGIGLGLIYLAYVLKDSPLEKYFKHSVFSDAKALPLKENEQLWEYNNRFYNNRFSLLGDDNEMKHLANFTRASAELHDLIVSSKIDISVNNLINEKVTTDEINYGLEQINTTTTSGIVQNITVKVNFNQFLNKPEQFKYEVYYFKNGIKNNTKEKPIPIVYNQRATIEEGTKSSPPKATVTLSFPTYITNSATNNSCILFICRLKLHSKSYYPIDYDNTERSLGAVIGLTSKTASYVFTNDHTYRENTCIAPKSKLLDYSAWKKDN